MKILKRLLLTNWYFIDCEVLDFQFINFITGKTGAGKSTIIDALQILFLGDTSGRFFNKAANEKSDRSLKGYLFGEISDSDEVGFEYKRSNCNFSSYIAAEFHDDIKNKYFTLGVHFDCYSDGEFDSKFFILDSKIPDNLFIKKDKAMDYRELKDVAKNEYDGKLQFYNGVTYQEAMRGKLGGLGKKFFYIFKKAVPFAPIDKIEKFISEFICDIKNNVDIQSMQSNIIYYKQLENDAENIKQRINMLSEIEKKFKEYQLEENKYKEQNYLMDRSSLEKCIKDIVELKTRAQSMEEEKTQLGKRLLKLKVDFEAAILERDRLVEEKVTSDIYREAEKIRERKNKYEEKIIEIEELKHKILNRLRNSLSRWKEFFNSAFEKIPSYREGCYTKAHKALEDIGSLLSADDTKLIKNIEAKIETIRNHVGEFISDMNNLYHHNQRELDDINKRLSILRLEINNLEKGIKPYDEKLLELKNEIEDRLSSRFGRVVKLCILSDVLDIRDKKWRNAIEAYLHSQKFYLLVDPGYFAEALKIYDELKFHRKFFDKGIIDIEKLMSENTECKAQSLAEEIVTENLYAKAYVDYILGRVTKCETLEELREHKVAITPTCMLYQNYVARQLNEERWRYPYIGKHSIEEQIILKKEEFRNLSLEQEEKNRQGELLAKLKTVENITENEIEDIINNCNEIKTLDDVREMYKAAVKDLENLNWSYLLDYDAKIAKVEKERDRISDEQAKTRDRITSLQGTIESIEKIQVKSKETEQHILESKIEQQYDRHWIISIGEPRFERELKDRKNAENIISAFNSQLSRTENQRNIRWDNLVNKRSEYNSKHMASLDITSRNNDRFDSEKQMLINTLITEYEAKIKDAKEKAQIQFREDFISKLKENIDTVKLQIDDMNKALKTNSFGKDEYHFEVKANPTYKKYYDMIMDKMLLDGFNLFSMEFQSKHSDTIEELFSNIAGSASGVLEIEERKQLEENIRKFTDYRTYLTFDLIVKDELGKESRLSKMLLKKSGGETQTPFYISVLASFVQTYRINMSGDNNNTLRLIVFDEAFSKMDDERIQESIKLLRTLGLQAIIAAPTEKVANIVPMVDRTLCVTKIKGTTLVRSFDPKEISEEMAI